MHGLGVIALIGLVAFCFGERTAKIVATLMLLSGVGLFLYIAKLVIMNEI